MPGGKREPGESDRTALCREISEELNVMLIVEIFSIMTVEELAHGYSEPTQVKMKRFAADYSGEIAPHSEIEEIAWLNYADLHKCAPAA